jgi:hypothetical protein
MTVALPEIIGRDAASALGLKRFFTGEPCKHGHVAERDVGSRECMECSRERARKHRAADPEGCREYGRKWRAANPEKPREYQRRWWAANKDKRAAPRLTKRAAAQLRKDRINKRQAAAQRRAARAGSELNGAGQAGL